MAFGDYSSSGTLRITDEARGLSYEADLPDTTAGRDCYELVRTGRMPYSSMGFTCFEDKFRHDGSALVRHRISASAIRGLAGLKFPRFSGDFAIGLG